MPRDTELHNLQNSGADHRFLWSAALWGRLVACGGLPARLPVFQEMLPGGLRGRRSQSGCPTTRTAAEVPDAA